MDRLPRALVLRVVTLYIDRKPRQVVAVLKDAATGDHFMIASLGHAADWLRSNSYRWGIGSNGIWEKAA